MDAACTHTCPGGVLPLNNPNRNGFKNGCGSPEMSVDFLSKLLFNMTPCCHDHDMCWGTCNAAMEKCDDAFEQCMLGVCKGHGDNPLCLAMAKIYKAAVSAVCPIYLESQQDVCMCPEAAATAAPIVPTTAESSPVPILRPAALTSPASSAAPTAAFACATDDITLLEKILANPTDLVSAMMLLPQLSGGMQGACVRCLTPLVSQPQLIPAQCIGGERVAELEAAVAKAIAAPNALSPLQPTVAGGPATTDASSNDGDMCVARSALLGQCRGTMARLLGIAI